LRAEGAASTLTAASAAGRSSMWLSPRRGATACLCDSEPQALLVCGAFVDALAVTAADFYRSLVKGALQPLRRSFSSY